MTRSSDKNIPIGSKDKWQTICNGNYHWKNCNVRKNDLDVKTPLLFVLLVGWSYLNFKQQFDSMSYRLSLQSFKGFV